MVALVGPSGAGKTTISQLVPRIYDVRSGRVLVGGHDVRTVTQQSLRDRIGVVSQDAHMFHDTIRGNLLYAKPDATDDELWSAISAAQISELVTALPGRASTRWSVTAATGSPAARSSGWRSPGCCSRHPRS